MTTTAIPSLDVNDFKSNIQDFDQMANGTGTYTDRFGDERLTLDEFMRRNGFEAPVAFASGIAVSRTTQTVTYNGDTYHAAPSAIPFTTTGTFNAAQWLMLRQNLEPQGIVLANKVITGFDVTGLQDGAWMHFAGRDAVGDGGGGVFRYSASSVQAADGGTVFAPTGGGRLFRDGWTVFGFNGPVSARWFGAKGDGSTDASAAVSAAFNSGAAEVIIPDGTFAAAAVTVTSTSLRKVSGAGVLKLKNGANTSLLNLTGTNELVFDGVNFDGNKANQSGATQATRGNYILINLTDATTVGTQFVGCKFTDAYYGAAINNSGIRTLIYGCFFYNCGMAPKDGTCDAIFNGTSALGTRILYNHIHNCSDYAVACDTSEIIVRGNRITDCYAGIGALTRQTISAHKICENEISGCDKPFDYFNAVDDSNPLNLFKDILIEGNTASSLTNTGAIVSFAANNATLKLCDNVRIKGNTIYTYLNQCSAVAVGGVASAKNTDVEISGNKIYGDGVTQSARYAINVTNTTGLTIFNNTFNGVDFAVSVTGCTGCGYENAFSVLRDAYANIDSSAFKVREVFSGLPRRAILVANGSTLTIDGEFNNVAGNPILIYDGGTLPANTLYIDRMVLKGTNGQTIFVDGSVTHKVVFNAPPAGTSQFSYNVLQSAWNINQAPTTGSWATGQTAYQLIPAIGQSKGWVCTAGGAPGSWVSEGNL